jgi:prephenate dehydrogenase
MTISSVGIVGHGNFGKFLQVLLARFTPEIQVKIFSPKTKLHAPYCTLEEVAKCDAVVLAVSIHALEPVIKKFVPLMSGEGILVDVSTVKKYPAGLLKKYAEGKKYIATHPMFGPESYAKRGENVDGFRVVITEHTLPENDVLMFCKTLEHLGFQVLRMTPDKHDKHLAQTLFLTHFIGQTVSRAGFVRTDIDTVSFGYLMDAVESVKHDKKLFQDVFRYNPHCKKVLKKFGIAEEQVQRLLES